MNRRRILAIGAGCVAMTWLPAIAQSARREPDELRSVAVLDFELVDNLENPHTMAADQARLRNATQQLRRELAERRLYDVVDASGARELESRLRGQQRFMYRCDDCSRQLGAALGVDLVMAPWVQKVSELILNVNVQIFDTRADKVTFSKSVDMRGNQDLSWTRAVRHLVRDIAEKRQRNPRYGQ